MFQAEGRTSADDLRLSLALLNHSEYLSKWGWMSHREKLLLIKAILLEIEEPNLNAILMLTEAFLGNYEACKLTEDEKLTLSTAMVSLKNPETIRKAAIIEAHPYLESQINQAATELGIVVEV